MLTDQDLGTRDGFGWQKRAFADLQLVFAE